MTDRERATVRFINVDLDVHSSEELRPLVEAIEPHAYSFERPSGQASFEVNEASPTEPEAVIREFIRIVKSLPPAARHAWDGASKRVLDIGLQSGRHPFCVSYRISAATLREAADMGADIAVTVYAVDPADEDPPQLNSPSVRT